jgi:hypothetical protein
MVDLEALADMSLVLVGDADVVVEVVLQRKDAGGRHHGQHRIGQGVPLSKDGSDPRKACEQGRGRDRSTDHGANRSGAGGAASNATRPRLCGVLDCASYRAAFEGYAVPL